jgi:hypothetical protein
VSKHTPDSWRKDCHVRTPTDDPDDTQCYCVYICPLTTEKLYLTIGSDWAITCIGGWFDTEDEARAALAKAMCPPTVEKRIHAARCAEAIGDLDPAKVKALLDAVRDVAAYLDRRDNHGFRSDEIDDAFVVTLDGLVDSIRAAKGVDRG